MSRVGKLPIEIPSGVTITVDNDKIVASGSKGTLEQFTMPGITVSQDNGILTVSRESEIKEHR